MKPPVEPEEIDQSERLEMWDNHNAMLHCDNCQEAQVFHFSELVFNIRCGQCDVYLWKSVRHDTDGLLVVLHGNDTIH